MPSTPIALAQVTSSSNPLWNGIAYGVMTKDWIVTANNSTASEATFKVKCAWADVGNLTDFFLGANNWASSTGLIATYIVGMQHPTAKGMFVDQVKQVPYTGVSSAVHVFDYAELQLHFKSLPFDPSSPAVIREDEVVPCGQLWPFSSNIYTGEHVNQQPIYKQRNYSIFVPEFKIRSTLIGVSTVPLLAILNTQGHTSGTTTAGSPPTYAYTALSFTFGGASYSIPGNFICYTGATTKRTVMSNGAQKYDVAHEFRCSPIMNMFPDNTADPTNKTAAQMFTLDANGFLNFPPTSFAGLGV